MKKSCSNLIAHTNIESIKLILTSQFDYQTLSDLLVNASATGDYERVLMLLSIGIKPDCYQRNLKSTPLIMAAQGGYLKIVELLLAFNANPNFVGTIYEITPIFMAAQNGHYEIVSCLLNAGANPSLERKGGATPLLVAKLNEHQSVISLLLEHKALFFIPSGSAPYRHFDSAALKNINELGIFILQDNYNDFKIHFDSIDEIKVKNTVINVLIHTFGDVDAPKIKKYLLYLMQPIEKPIDQKKFDFSVFMPKPDTPCSECLSLEWVKFTEEYRKLGGDKLNNNKQLEEALFQFFTFIQTPSLWIPMVTEFNQNLGDALEELNLVEQLEAFDIERLFTIGFRILPHITEREVKKFDDLNALNRSVNRVTLKLLLNILQKHGLNRDENMTLLLKRFKIESPNSYLPILKLNALVEHENLEPLMNEFGMLFIEEKTALGMILHNPIIHLLQWAMFFVAREKNIIKINESVTASMILKIMLEKSGFFWNTILDKLHNMTYKQLSPFNKVIRHPSFEELNHKLYSRIRIYSKLWPFSFGDYLRTNNCLKYLNKLELLRTVVAAIKVAHRSKIDPNIVLSVFSRYATRINLLTFFFEPKTLKAPSFFSNGILLKKDELKPCTKFNL